jgi:hypothetical protein
LAQAARLGHPTPEGDESYEGYGYEKPAGAMGSKAGGCASGAALSVIYAPDVYLMFCEKSRKAL